jgi:hypothetical protein
VRCRGKCAGGESAGQDREAEQGVVNYLRLPNRPRRTLTVAEGGERVDKLTLVIGRVSVATSSTGTSRHRSPSQTLRMARTGAVATLATVSIGPGLSGLQPHDGPPSAQ